MGLDSKTTRRIPRRYKDFVKAEMGNAVVILKTIGCHPAATGETFRTLMRQGNFADLARIMTVKGMSKSDQQPIIDAYNKKVPVNTQRTPFFRDESSQPVTAFAETLGDSLAKFLRITGTTTTL